jgi:hypothetical protein
MRNGRQRVLQPWSAAANGNEKAEKYPHGLDDRFGLTEPTTSGALEDKDPQSLGLKVFGLLTEGMQEIEDGQAVSVERGLSGPAMRAHPLSKRPEEFGVGWWWADHGSRSHQPRGFEEGDKVACTHKHGTIATARIAEGLSHLQVLPKPLKRFGIEIPKAEIIIVRPLREAVYATNQAQDTTRVIPALFEPKNEGIEMGTCGARAISLSSEGPFDIGVQHAALLHGRP